MRNKCSRLELNRNFSLDKDISERIDNRDLPKSHWVKSSELYANYADWKRERGEAPLGESKFSESLQVEFTKARSNGMRFAGLRLNPFPNI